jgi:XTP/dITP diphosphohydrolase
VKKKALEAYRICLQSCVVEHGGLFLDAWKTSQEKPGLLGGIGQVVWDSVGQLMCGFLRKQDTRAASAQSVVGYCDGRRIHVYSGTTRGELTCEERGAAGLRWDPIFKPAGSDLTYGEMTSEQKRETSPEEKAWEQFFTSVMKEPRQS